MVYYLEVNNITDSAGNLISPQGNLVRFSIQNLDNLENLNVYPNPVTSKHLHHKSHLSKLSGK